MAATEVLFEFLRVGRQMRVAAVEANTGVEVVVICPLTASKAQMQQLALAKLQKKLGAAQSETAQRLF